MFFAGTSVARRRLQHFFASCAILPTVRDALRGGGGGVPRWPPSGGQAKWGWPVSGLFSFPGFALFWFPSVCIFQFGTCLILPLLVFLFISFTGLLRFGFMLTYSNFCGFDFISTVSVMRSLDRASGQAHPMSLCSAASGGLCSALAVLPAVEAGCFAAARQRLRVALQGVALERSGRADPSARPVSAVRSSTALLSQFETASPSGGGALFSQNGNFGLLRVVL